MKLAMLLTFCILLAAGQILFKKAALVAGDGPMIPGILNIWTVLALVLYGAATIMWIGILQTTPLSTAYPFGALAFVIVPLAAYFVFNEQLSVTYLVGASLIFIGIVLTSL